MVLPPQPMVLSITSSGHQAPPLVLFIPPTCRLGLPWWSSLSPPPPFFTVSTHVRCFNQIWRVLIWNYDILSFLIFVFIYLFLVTFCLISCDIRRSVWHLNFSFLARWRPKMPNEEDSSSQRHHSQINYLDWHHCVASLFDIMLWYYLIFVNVWSTHVWH